MLDISDHKPDSDAPQSASESPAGGTASDAPLAEDEASDATEETPDEGTDEGTDETGALIVTPHRSAWKTLLHALEIDGQWFRHNLGLLFVITVGLLLFVTNRYQADQEIIEEGLLRDTLEDIRYKALTKTAELTLKKRSSHIETLLRQWGDSTLKAPKDAPYIIMQPAKSSELDNGSEAEK